MKNALIVLMVAIVCLASGYLLGQRNIDDTIVQDIEDITTDAQFISITDCDTQDIPTCFGSGREVFTETDNTTIFNLISKDGVLRYGLLDKNTSKLYELVIQ